MTDSHERRNFQEYAKLFSKEQGWGDANDILQELLGAFLRGHLSDVSWPRGDGPIRPDGTHLMTIRHEAVEWPDMGPNPSIQCINVPMKTPPQKAVSRDEWLQAFRVFGGQDRRIGADWSLLANIPISEYPAVFRRPYIERLYTTDAEVARWLRSTNRQPPEWTSQTVLPAKKKPTNRMGRPSYKHEIEKAYRDFKAAGKIDFSKPKTAAYKQIRIMVHQSLGVVKGPGDETMRKVIGPLFDIDKKAKARSNKL